MLGLKLEETRVYQEAKAEGSLETKLETVPKLLARGLSQEEIAEILELTIGQVREAAQIQSAE